MNVIQKLASKYRWSLWQVVVLHLLATAVAVLTAIALAQEVAKEVAK